MHGKSPTKAEQRRFDIITREVGCICCRMKFARYIAAQANHLLKGYRIGHSDVTAECPWHHMGECLTGTNARAMRKAFGPSRKLHKKAFRKQFGSDAELLSLMNKYVAAFEARTIGEQKTHYTGCEISLGGTRCNCYLFGKTVNEEKP